MIKKNSAYYQRKFRDRQREKGLVKREIWVHPDQIERVRGIEKNLREEIERRTQTSMRPSWTTTALYEGVAKSELITSERAHIELIEGVDPIILVEMKEFGDLPIFLNVAGGQIVAESVLWPQAEVIDTHLFNETVLRTHKLFPLSTICLERRFEDDYYMMFGALSATSDLQEVLHEIDELALNVLNATEMYDDLLQPR